MAADVAICMPALAIALIMRGDAAALFAAFSPLVLPASAACAILGIGGLLVDLLHGARAKNPVIAQAAVSVASGCALIAAAFIVGLGAQPALGILFAAVHFGLGRGCRELAERLRAALQTRKCRRLMIYGAGAHGLQALASIKGLAGFRAVAFVDDNPALHGVFVGGLRVHSPVRLVRLAARLRAQEIVIAKPSLGAAERVRLVSRLEASGLSVRRLPNLSHLTDPCEAAAKLTGAITCPAPNNSAGARAFYAGRTVMVTGAGGSIGSELAERVLNFRPARLILLEQSEFALYRIDNALRPLAEAGGIPLISVLGSVGDAALVGRVLRDNQVEMVLHAAAYKHVPLVEANPAAALDNNVLATETLARLSAREGVARFVLISTDKAVRPQGVMGLSKWIAEQVVRDLGRRNEDMATCVVRFGNVLGSSGSVLPLFEEQVRSGGPVTITDPRMERYFMSIDEAVHLVLEAGAMAPIDGIHLFGMGSPVRIETLARQVIAAFGYSVRDADRPDGDIALRYTGARPGEKLAEDLSWQGKLRRTQHGRIFAVEDPCLCEFEIARLLRQVRKAVSSGQGMTAADVQSLSDRVADLARA